MKPQTRARFEREVLQPLAQGYGVGSVRESFAIEPSVSQRLNDKIVEQSTFLGQINIVPVDEIKGENILGYAKEPVTSRTDTTTPTGERKPKDVLGLGKYEYELKKTDSDVLIRYSTIDSWAKFPDLADRYSRYVQERIAGDRELIGWYGVDWADNTDLATYPLLEDVNKGWLQYMRENLPANILEEGGTPGEIRIGLNGDYSCLDVAVNDLLEGIPYYLQKDLVALIGRDLISRERAILFEAVQGTPTEKQAMDSFSQKYGNLPWQTPSFFPARGLVITPLANLSIYHQDSSWRRKLEDNAKKDQYEDYLSRNEGYVVEVPEMLVAVEFDNVKLPFTKPDGTIEWR